MEDPDLDGHAFEDDEPSDSNLGPAKLSWKPSRIVFSPYSSMEDRRPGGTSQRPGSLRIIVNKPLVVRLTKDIIETYRVCKPTFTYSKSLNPKRYLTNPSTGVLNDGLDNLNSDYILAVNAALINSDFNRRYIVKDLLGQGTFGQVVKCWSIETNSFVAVKVIKNQPAYYHQARVEISILTKLNQEFDPEDKHHIVRIQDHFVFHGHLCIAFEMLGVNLYELIRVNQFRGISLSLLKRFAKQILDSLLVLRNARVIHCDLKPENILLTTSLQSAEIKLIDFGSACMENWTIYSYIQSRFYRSPEVLLGHPYTTAIDMWSFGCIAAELFLGLPLFPGASEYDLMKRMIERLGSQPPDKILRAAKNTSKYFKHVGAPLLDEGGPWKGAQTSYQFLTESEYEAREMKKPASGKQYFNYVKLEDIILNYPHRKKMTEEELAKENQTRLSFIDFLRGLVQFDPVKRWTPGQAVQHPFVTEERFTGPYRPFPETPHTPVHQKVTVDHNPGSGHWFGAGLSPQVVNINGGIRYTSPQYQPIPFNHASSYGSFGSYGSYGEGVDLGSSFGSYGDVNVYMNYCPVTTPPVNNQSHIVPGGSGLGEGPDTWQRTVQVPQWNALGVSPSSGMFRPMSLGVSPSQFTPPSSQFQLSPGSPGRYGPTSPARGGIHGTALGKAAALGQYHKRRGLGTLGSLHLPSQENTMPHWQGHHHNNLIGSSDMGTDSYLDCNSQGGYLGSPCDGQGSSPLQPWRQRAGTGISTGSAISYDQKTSMPYCPAPKAALLSTTEMCSDGGEDNSPSSDPGDWDPNYSDELLFQEDVSDSHSPRSRVSGGIRSVQASSSTPSLVGGWGRAAHSYTQFQGNSTCNSNLYRPNGLVQGHTNLEGSPPSVHGLQIGHMHSMSKPSYQGPFLLQQNSASQLRQHSSPFVEQHFQHLCHSHQNSDQQLPFTAVGQHNVHCHYAPNNIFPADQSSQSSNAAHSRFRTGEHGGNSSGYLLPSPQRDSPAAYVPVPTFLTNASTGVPGASGINSSIVFGNTATQLTRAGQRNEHPVNALPTSAHGRQDYRRIS